MSISDFKKSETGKWLALVLRVLVGAICIISAVSKLTHLTEFTWEIVSLKLFYWVLAKPIAFIMPAFEFVVGIFILFGLFLKFSTIHLGLMTLFRVWIAYYASTMLGMQNCKCFGTIIRIEYGSGYYIFLAVLILTTVTIFLLGNSFLAIDNRIKRMM
jgi:uncharacterized membrane protein YphA (DoxX/SURF4 family)